MKRYGFRLLALICLLTTSLPAAARAHPLDEYAQNTYVEVAPDRTELELHLTPGVLVAPRIAALIDTNGDGAFSEAEAEAYANDAVLRDLTLEVDGEPQRLSLAGSSFPSPLEMSAGVGTITLRVAAEAPTGAPGEHFLSFRNDHEPDIGRYLVNAFETTGDVEISQRDRDELQNNIRVDYATTAAPPASSGTGAAPGGILERQERLAGYLYEPLGSPWLLLASLGLSALLGGLHALTPGHGKALATAYLVGSRGTVKHAAVLVATVTFTQTASVIAVGLLALLAGQLFLPDVLVPALEVGAGLLVVALGSRLMWTRRRRGGDHRPGHHHHVPPGDVRPGHLLAMGVSGGLLPYPEALGIVLVAAGLDRTAPGLALILAFGLSLDVCC